MCRSKSRKSAALRKPRGGRMCSVSVCPLALEGGYRPMDSMARRGWDELRIVVELVRTSVNREEPLSQRDVVGCCWSCREQTQQCRTGIGENSNPWPFPRPMSSPLTLSLDLVSSSSVPGAAGGVLPFTTTHGAGLIWLAPSPLFLRFGSVHALFLLSIRSSERFTVDFYAFVTGYGR